MEYKKQTTNMKRLAQFRDKEIIHLIKAIEQRELLWNLVNKKHFDRNATKCAWESVADEMNTDSDTCRNAWQSLRDSYRYHVRRASKSISPGSVPLQNAMTIEILDWKFAPYLAFLTGKSSQRRQFGSSCEDPNLQSNSEDPDLQSNSEDPDLQFDNDHDTIDTDERSQIDSEKGMEKDLTDMSAEPFYSYEPKAKRKRVEDNSSTSQVVEILEKFADQQSAVRPAVLYWQSCLQRLSETDAEKLERKMTKFLLDELDALED